MLGEDGKPHAELLLKDGLHMNDKGYEIWAEPREAASVGKEVVDDLGRTTSWAGFPIRPV